jgi:hypothetical protein
MCTCGTAGLDDPAANTVYAKPAAAFDQHRRYMIVVTDGVHDATGIRWRPIARLRRASKWRA